MPLWLRSEPRHGAFTYEPNIEHPLIQSLISIIGDGEQRHLQMILDLLGTTLPYEAIYADMCRDSRSEDSSENIQALLGIAESMLAVTGLDLEHILGIDPLDRYPQHHDQLRKELEC